MPSRPFLVISTVPVDLLVRHLSVGRAPAVLFSDFRAASEIAGRSDNIAGVILAEAPGGVRQGAVIRALGHLRHRDAGLPLAVVSDAPSERMVRATSLARATVLLRPIRRAEVARFIRDATPGNRVGEALRQATAWFIRSCGIRPDSRPAQVLLLRVLGHSSTEVCAALNMAAKTYRRHVETLTSASALPRMADIVSLVLQRALAKPISWEPPQDVASQRVSAAARYRRNGQSPK